MHGFGAVGRDLGLIPFHHYWLQARKRGTAKPLGHYSLSQCAAYAHKFMPNDPLPQAPMGAATYAYHFDAGLYAGLLRKYAEGRNVRRHEGIISGHQKNSENGYLQHVKLQDGREISGDLFIDCSGFRGLLIGGAMDCDYVDWSKWLPCNRAMAVPCASADTLLPYTRATAREAGWQWRIPLQHRIGNGIVYCSDFIDDDRAAEILMANLDGAPLADPRPLRFTTGHRSRFWEKNVVALGLAGGFLEPLESTSIHLVQAGIKQLIDLLPAKDIAQADINQFNRQTAFEYERIRDFLVLHYFANNRKEPFWQEMRRIPLPDGIVEKLENFQANGRIFRFNEELFTELAWLQVMVGQGILPSGYHPLADVPGNDAIDKYLASIEDVIAAKLSRMPSHRDYLKQNSSIPVSEKQ
jgi:tryptophan halogenase